MKKPNMPELSEIEIKQDSILAIMTIINFFKKIKLNFGLNRRRKNFLKEYIQKDKLLNEFVNYNEEMAIEQAHEKILKNYFEEQTGIVFQALEKEISFVELMVNFRETQNDKKLVFLRLELLNKLKNYCSDKHKYISNLDYNAFRDKYMIKFKIWVNENTYFEYEHFLIVKQIDEMLKNVN